MPSPPAAPARSYEIQLLDDDDDDDENQPGKKLCTDREARLQAAVGRKARRMAIAYVYVQVFDCEHEAFWSCERAGAGHGNGGGWVHGTLRKIADHCELSTTLYLLLCSALSVLLSSRRTAAPSGVRHPLGPPNVSSECRVRGQGELRVCACR